ncbi:hypothetical protein PG984_010153 [Apiospora sp. TS-2023a]
MATVECLPRPRTTKELLERLKTFGFNPDDHATKIRSQKLDEQDPALGHRSASRGKKEAEALRALSQRMTRVFIDNPQDLQVNVNEAAALAPFTKLEDFPGLFTGFVEAIARGTGDNAVPSIKVLEGFNAVLHCPQALQCMQHEHLRTQIPLGHAVLSLTKRLQTAMQAADPEAQYRLLCILCSVLDAMNEVKFGGISEVGVVKPLIELLREKSEHPELRLAQAARYAAESLRGIPSDVSPWKKLGESMVKTLGAAANLAGGVVTLDPTKILDGMMNAPDAVEGLVKSVISILALIESLGALSSTTSDMYRSTERVVRIRPAPWHIALRYTDLFIRGRQPLVLGSMLNNPDFPLGKDKHFLCGLCSQLEQAAIEGGGDNLAIPVLKDFLNLKGSTSSSRRVQAWIQLTIPSAQITKLSLWHRIKSRIIGACGATTFETNIGYSKVANGRLKDEGELLRKAWETCPGANLFYADQVLRNFYTNKDLRLLDVVRLDPTKCLPMAQCYINLSIVVGGSDRHGGSRARHPILRRRFDIWEAGGAGKVSLSDLFPSKTSKEQGPMMPKRVLICGKAGVGKSTLCKRIVYDSIHHDLWAGVIDRVIWLPLRELKGRDSWDYDLRQFLQERYFKGLEDEELFANALFQEYTRKETKTLFLLDGPDQVEQYVKAVSPEHADKIQAFIDDHPAIGGLIQIPVQLDAFCYSFEADAIDTNRVPQTMTELYRAIELAIWRKDVVQLEKKRRRGSNPISQTDARGSTPDEIWRRVQGQMEEFATNYLVDFWDNKRNDLTGNLPLQQDIPIFGELSKISFLRTSRPGSSFNDSYHFLHLTYQEYFAARFFVQHWPDKVLPGVELRADAFLCREKYNPRYDIVWRFVAGLLHEHGGAARFLRTIEAAPYDLFGAAHDLLMMHCLAEVPQSNTAVDLGGIRANFEHHLLQWITEGKVSVGRYLSAEPEFPESVLLGALPGATPHIHETLVDALIGYKRKSTQTFNHCTSALAGCGGVLSKLNALRVLSTQPLPDSVVPVVIAFLETESDESILTRGLQQWGLSSPSNLPDAILLRLADFVVHPREGIRCGARDVLKWYKALRKEVLVKIVDKMLNHDKTTKSESQSGSQSSYTNTKALMIDILATQSSLNETILHTILDILSDADPALQMDLQTMINKNPTLPQSIVERLFNMLRDPDTHAWKAAASILSKESVRVEIIPELLDLMKHPGVSDPEAAVSVLRQPGFTPPECLREITVMLQSNARDSAATILAGRDSEFPTDILHQITSLLDEQDPGKRNAAMHALEKQPSVPNKALQQAMHTFREGGCDSAQKILHSQDFLPVYILEELVGLLETSDNGLRKEAASILEKQAGLPGKIVKQVAGLLEHPGEDMKGEAAFVLSNQPELAAEVLLKIAALEEHPNELIRNYAARALNRQSSIPADLVPRLFGHLESPDAITRSTAITALDRIQPGLPDSAIEALTRLLEAPFEDTIQAAIAALGGMGPKVPSDTVVKVASLLEREHEPPTVRRISRFLDDRTAPPSQKELFKSCRRVTDQAAEILSHRIMSDEILARLLSEIDYETFKKMYRHWLKESFRHQMAWQANADGASVITFPEGNRTVHLDSKLKKAIIRVRKELKLPPRDFGTLLEL